MKEIEILSFWSLPVWRVGKRGLWWLNSQISPWRWRMFHVVDDAAGIQLTWVMACVGGDSATRSHHDGGVCSMLLVMQQAPNSPCWWHVLVVIQQPDLTMMAVCAPCCWWCSRHPTHPGDGMCWWWFSNQSSPWRWCVWQVAKMAPKRWHVLWVVGSDSVTSSDHNNVVGDWTARSHHVSGMCCKLLVVMQDPDCTKMTSCVGG